MPEKLPYENVLCYQSADCQSVNGISHNSQTFKYKLVIRAKQLMCKILTGTMSSIEHNKFDVNCLTLKYTLKFTIIQIYTLHLPEVLGCLDAPLAAACGESSTF